MYVQLLEEIPEAKPYLLEYYMNQLPAPNLPPSHSYDSARVLEEADFIPTTLVMTALQHMTTQSQRKSGMPLASEQRADPAIASRALDLWNVIMMKQPEAPVDTLVQQSPEASNS